MNGMVPRKAGQSLRERASQQRRLLTILLTSAYLLGLIAAAVFVPDKLPFYVAALPIVMVLLIWKGHPDIRAAIKGIGHISEGARGEEKVGAALGSLETSGYRVLHDIDTGKGNIDHVVVGPTGVFVIETKATLGRLWFAKGGRLMSDGFSKEKWVAQALAEAYEVKSCLKAVGLDLWVEALIVLTRTPLPKGPMKTSSVTVIEVGDLRDKILGRNARRLTHVEMDRAVAAILR